jgi:hypothetical protein
LKKLDARRLERRRGIIAAAMNHLSNHWVLHIIPYLTRLMRISEISYKAFKHK